MDAGAETGPYAIVTESSGTGARGSWPGSCSPPTTRSLRGWVRRLVDDDDTAHEIASEAFVRLLSKWTSIDKLDSPQSYLYMIATNLVRDHWRKKERERRAFTKAAAGSDPEPYSDPSQDVDIRELLGHAARQAARAVPAALLRRVRHQGDRRAAQKAEGTIKADLYHARAKLKEMLAQRATGPMPIQRGGTPREHRAAPREHRAPKAAANVAAGGGPMPADNELDPLDSWLNRQVRPLPPPSGTFELITRRARRRRIRKAVVSVASAAPSPSRWASPCPWACRSTCRPRPRAATWPRGTHPR